TTIVAQEKSAAPGLFAALEFGLAELDSGAADFSCATIVVPQIARTTTSAAAQYGFPMQNASFRGNGTTRLRCLVNYTSVHRSGGQRQPSAIMNALVCP